MQKLAAFFLIVCGSTVASPPYPSVHAQKIVAPQVGPRDRDSFGYTLATGGSWVAVGQPSASLGGQNRGMVAVYNAVSGQEIVAIPNPDPGTWNFGSTLNLSGDLLVVGHAPGGDGEPTSVHGFDLASPQPANPVRSFSSPPPAGDFGLVVAISDQKVAVAAGGTVYIYGLDAPHTAVPQHILAAPPDHGYGYNIVSLAIDGSRIAVGGFFPIVDEADDHVVHVYDLGGPFPEVPVHALHAPGIYGVGFGVDVALHGNRLIVGAEFVQHDQWVYGAVYGYDLDGASPSTPVLALPAPDLEVFSQFGHSVDLSGDRLLVGAPWLGEGRAYVYDVAGFEAGTASTIPELTLGASAAERQAFFGAAVALSDTRAFVGGSWTLGFSPQDPGRTFVYDLQAADPVAGVTELQTPARSGGAAFGRAVALSERWGLAVGGRSDLSGSGNAWLFDTLSANPSDTVHALKLPPQVPPDAWVSALAVDGHLALTGMPDNDLAVVYDLDSSSPDEPIATLAPPAPSPLAYGAAVAVSGQIAVVGAPVTPNSCPQGGGQVWIYALADASPTVPVLLLQDPQPASGRSFGRSVAVVGRKVVVAGSQECGGSATISHVYFYDLDSATPDTPTHSLPFPNAVAVALSESHLVVSQYDRLDAYRIDADGAPTALTTIPMPPNTYGRAPHVVTLDGARLAVPDGRNQTTSIAGPVQIFDLDAPDPQTVVAQCSPLSPQPYDGFSVAVALHGSRLLAGAPRDSTRFYEQGAVALFEAHPLDADADHLPDAWEIQHFGGIGAQKPWDDFDADGASNVLEYAFGSNPAVLDAIQSPPPVIENDHLTLTVTKMPGVACRAESGSLLDDFDPGEIETLVDSATLLKVRDRVAISDAPRRFMRVVVWDTALPFP